MPTRHSLKSFLLATSVALALTAPIAVSETPDDAVFNQFTAHAETSSYNVNYQAIGQFTNAFAQDERGRLKVAYSAVSGQGEKFLQRYVGYLENVPVNTLSRDDQLAYWLNTRNMLIVKAMADSSSRRRMKANRGTPDAPGSMWTDKLFMVGGIKMSINDIEQNIILANWSDTPNIIYGLYQGSQGGVSLPADGFTGKAVHTELEAAGREFVNSRNGVRVRGKKAQLPEIYTWYSDELFGGDEQAVLTHVSGLAEPKTATKLAATTGVTSRKFSYSSDEFVIRQQAAPAGGFSRGAGAGAGGAGS
ncbi:MAG: DUF547 domain-containing protein [Pseudomonadota bacterium]